ncbi:MAG: DUF6276 family protein [Haloquadratum sp.]
MPESCPACERPLCRLDVPPALREFAPSESPVVGSCPRCLRTYALEETGPAEDQCGRADLPDGIPDGEGGVALALAVGLLDSLATNRAAIQALVEHAERSGVDVFLALDRLTDDESLEPHASLARRRQQLASLLD